jgi:hypothetical protein
MMRTAVAMSASPIKPTAPIKQAAIGIFSLLLS